MEARSEILPPIDGDASGVRLHALHWGDERDPLLIALHGGGANAHWWDHLAPQWAQHFHVVALDFRGHGESTRPQTFESAAFQADLGALLAALGDERAVLVGHSMGAAVALARAATSQQTRALVLLDPARGGGQRAHRGVLLALSLRRSYATRDEAIERLRFLPAADHCPESLRRSIAEHSVAQEADGRWSYRFDTRAFGVPPAARPDPSRVRCPTLIVRGSESPILSAEGAAALQAEIGDALVVEIGEAGHHVQLDAPEATAEAITTFLDELDPE